MTLAKNIRDQERGGRAHVGVIDGEDESASPGLMKVMTYILGEKRDIQPAIPDSVVDQKLKSALKLYQWVNFPVQWQRPPRLEEVVWNVEGIDTELKDKPFLCEKMAVGWTVGRKADLLQGNHAGE